MPVGKAFSHRPAPLPSPKESGGGPKAGDRGDGAPQVQKSNAGKTASQHLRDLVEKAKQAGGPDLDLKKLGWTCKLEKRTPESDGLDPVFVDGKGNEFFKTKEVLRHLGLKAIRLYTRDEAYQGAREYYKSAAEKKPPPFDLGPLTVLKLGKIEWQREGFHSHRHIFPIGYNTRYKDPKTKVLYETEILDGAALDEKHAAAEKSDGPVFSVTKKGEEEKDEHFYGRSTKEVWRKALDDPKGEDHSGMKEYEVRKLVEGLKNSQNCKDYEFLVIRDQLASQKEAEARVAALKEAAAAKSAKSSGGKSTTQKELKAKEKEFKAKERAEREAEKAKEKAAKEEEKRRINEERERVKEEKAEQRREEQREAARKRREENAKQAEEERWNTRFPIEDLAVELEEEVLREAEAAGHEVLAQRAAARAAVDAVARGLRNGAALEAGRVAASKVKDGEAADEAMAMALEAAEEWDGEDVEMKPAAVTREVKKEGGDTDMPDAASAAPEEEVVDAKELVRPGTKVQMLFEEGGQERWFQGFVQRLTGGGEESLDIAFYDGESSSVPRRDKDVKVLSQGVLRLPLGAPAPRRAPPHASDVMGIMNFIENFRGELGMPKGSLTDLLDGLASPAASPFLGELYMSLLYCAMQAAKQQTLVVPETWFAETTLTQHTWPEVARRWMLFGPWGEMHRRRFAEACSAVAVLPQQVCGNKASPQAHLTMLQCLIEDCLEFSSVHDDIQKRLEKTDEIRTLEAQRQKEYADGDKQYRKERERREAEANAEDEDDPEPQFEIPPELLESADDSDKQAKIEELQEEFDRLHDTWEKKHKNKSRADEREREQAERDQRRFYDRHEKQEADNAAKLERHQVRHAPLGMDRHRNRYWWFTSDKPSLYVEPHADVPGAGTAEWRLYSGAEEIEALKTKLNVKGVREAKLHKGLEKIASKLTSAASVMPDTLGAAEMSGLRQAKQFAAEAESFQAMQQELQNVAEVLEDDQRRILTEQSASWLEDTGKATDCSQLATLMLLIEAAVTDSLAPRKQQAAAANKAAAGESGAASSEGALMETDGPAGGVAAAETNGAHGEWITEGSEYVGRRVRRNVRGDDGKLAGWANGSIVGWLPADKSDFYCKETGLPSALWHVRFDDEEIGEEDLEHAEVQAARLEYHKLQAALSSSRAGVPGPAKRGEEGRDAAAAAPAEAEEAHADEGVVDMVEASNKPARRALWTSSLQRDAWRAEGREAGRAGSLPRLNYAAAVLCDHALRVFGKRREELSSAPRRKGTKRNRLASELDAVTWASAVSASSAPSTFTESGRKVARVSYKDHDSDPSDEN